MARVGRRQFLTAAGALFAAPFAAHAQPGSKRHRVALVFTTAPVSEMAGPDPAHPFPRAFLRALGALFLPLLLLFGCFRQNRVRD